VKVIADLHLHSKYSRAVSSQMVLPVIAEWAVKKGIGLVGTGDFTHPMWFREIKSSLEEAGNGVYQLKNSKPQTLNPKFLLTCEISCIYTDKGKGRRVHVLVCLPKIADVERFNAKLTLLGANLFSDGRPITGLTVAQIAKIALEANPKALIIPAHVWTPWFGIYGANSGYDSLAEAFGDLAKDIPAVETGLSSDAAMNWRMEELKERAIVSFSDAHSPAKLGREATVLKVSDQSLELSYDLIKEALMAKIAYTIEFYPEEGKYHYTGHRRCGVVYSPNEARKMGLICPVCGKTLTLGVASRVETLGKIETETETEKDKAGVRWIYPKGRTRPPYVTLVPLMEILAEAGNVGVGSQKVISNYQLAINNLGSEFKILLETPVAEIEKVAGEEVAEAISKVRAGDISIDPGYDGVFGKVKVWAEKSEPSSQQNLSSQQSSLF